MLKIFADHAETNGKIITLHEAACIMARALAPMWAAYSKPDGYEHYELAAALKYNVINVAIDGEDLENEKY